MKKTLLLTLGMSSMLLATSPNMYVDMRHVMLTHSNNGTTSDFKNLNALEFGLEFKFSSNRSKR